MHDSLYTHSFFCCNGHGCLNAPEVKLLCVNCKLLKTFLVPDFSVLLEYHALQSYITTTFFSRKLLHRALKCQPCQCGKGICLWFWCSLIAACYSYIASSQILLYITVPPSQQQTFVDQFPCEVCCKVLPLQVFHYCSRLFTDLPSLLLLAEQELA